MKWNEVIWAEVQPGQMVLISGLHEDMQLSVPVSGTLNNNILIRSDPHNPAILRHCWFDFSGRNYLTFKGFTLENSGQFRAARSHHITLKDCHLASLNPENIRFVQLGSGCDDWIIKNCLIENCGNGIYTLIDVGGAANRLTVKDCIIRNIGAPDDNDWHAVGVQGGEGHIVTGNTISNTGTAVCFWAPSTVPMRNIKISGNKIEGCKAIDGGAMGNGISFEGQLPPKGMRTGIVISNNTVSKCEGNGIRATLRDPISIVKNKVSLTKGEPIKIVSK